MESHLVHHARLEGVVIVSPILVSNRSYNCPDINYSSFMYMTGAIGVYAFLFFLPVILRNGLGFSLQLSFILSAPPALFSVISAMTVSWLADKTQLRGPFVFFQGVIAIIGLCMTGFLSAPTPRYIGVFLGVAGVNGLVVTCLAWQANNVRGDAKRSVATAIQIMCSGIGGIYSSLVFRQQVSGRLSVRL
jgi:cyanate permease